ncbi:MAG TPA: hypothetical protein VH299_14650 [Solirubrobacterales bacterium]|nr:hypothetical protein [Solirubrobacterales bacterium]
MNNDLEVGRWYAFEGTLHSQRDRPVQILAVEFETVHGKWATGEERVLERARIGQKVEDAVPGETEPCLICGGRGRVALIEQRSDHNRPWAGHVAGSRLCPNCRALT